MTDLRRMGRLVLLTILGCLVVAAAPGPAHPLVAARDCQPAVR